MPDPVSKVTWDNYAMISPELAKTLIGIDVFNNQKQADTYEVTRKTGHQSDSQRETTDPACADPAWPESIHHRRGTGLRRKAPIPIKTGFTAPLPVPVRTISSWLVLTEAPVIYTALPLLENRRHICLAQTQVHGSSEGPPRDRRNECGNSYEKILKP